VHFIFLVIGPADQPEAYLQLLSQISRFMRVPRVTKRLLSAHSADEVVEIIGEM
jgi:mannitol/fructose-specific phosphotransferase system IIA component (Ntr-type)